MHAGTDAIGTAMAVQTPGGPSWSPLGDPGGDSPPGLPYRTRRAASLAARLDVLEALGLVRGWYSYSVAEGRRWYVWAPHLSAVMTTRMAETFVQGAVLVLDHQMARAEAVEAERVAREEAERLDREEAEAEAALAAWLQMGPGEAEGVLA